MKRAQVIWSNEALVDLEIIYDFLAQKSRQAAKHVVENIIEKVAQLENFPESGPHQEKIINNL